MKADEEAEENVSDDHNSSNSLTNSKISNIFKSREKVFILDGGMATQLEKNAKSSHVVAGENWGGELLVTDPEKVKEVHEQYFRSGAEIVETNTYQLYANSKFAKKHGFATLLQRAVTIAKAAREKIYKMEQLERQIVVKETSTKDTMAFTKKRTMLIAGSVGSYGAHLGAGEEYTGYIKKNPSVNVKVLQKFHRTKMKLLYEKGCDLLITETIPELEEGIACSQLLKDLQIPGIVSFQCSDHAYLGSRRHTLKDAVTALVQSDYLLAVGLNCTHAKFILQLVNVIKSVYPSIPVIVYPNAGEDYDAEKKDWIKNEDVKIEKLPHSLIKQWVKAGVKGIGGCCRIYASDIKKLSLVLKDS
eukprot:g1245.t1